LTTAAFAPAGAEDDEVEVPLDDGVDVVVDVLLLLLLPHAASATTHSAATGTAR